MTVLGVDVSKWQPAVDWETLKANGVEFVFIKATQGDYHTDPMLLSHLEGANRVGMVIGLYHWCDPLVSYESQAQYFINVTKGLNFHMASADVEQFWASWQEWSDKNITKFLVPEAISENARNILAYWKDRIPQVPVLYSRASFIHAYARPMMDWLNDEYPPLWMAHYPYNTDTITTTWDTFKAKHLPKITSPDLPQGCTKWKFWQFTGDKFLLPGIYSKANRSALSATDVNFWNGTLDELHKFANYVPAQEEKPPMTVTGKALGVWLAPDRTPYVDFDELKRGGVEFIVAWGGEGKSGDPLIDRKPKSVGDIQDWLAHVINEAYRIDVPVFVQWHFHPEHGTNHDQAPIKQLQALEYRLDGKTFHGVFSSVNTMDGSKPIAPFWVRTRWLDFNARTQKRYPHCWVGPIGQVSLRNDPALWQELEPHISKDGVPAGSGPALAWMEDNTTGSTVTWEELPNHYPDATPKKLPSQVGGNDAKWYWWCWSLDHTLPGIWMDKEHTTPGKPWLCFFDGNKAALHEFAFYEPHGYTAPNDDPSDPPPPPPPPGNDDLPSDPSGVIAAINEVNNRIRELTEIVKAGFRLP